MGLPLYYLMGYVFIFVMPLITVIYGIVGVVKDNKVVMAIIGLNLGIIVWIMLVMNFYFNFIFYTPYYYP